MSTFRIVAAQISSDGTPGSDAVGVATATFDPKKVRYAVTFSDAFANKKRPAVLVTPQGDSPLHARHNRVTRGEKPHETAEIDTYVYRGTGHPIEAGQSAFHLIVTRAGDGERSISGRGDEPLALAAAEFGEDGSLTRGHGYAQKATVGADNVYTVPLTGLFTAAPAVVVTPVSSAAKTRVVVIRACTTSAVTVVVLDETCTPVRCPFTLLAAAPPADESGALNKARILAGVVHGSDTTDIGGGGGFGVTQPKTARYPITFDTAFATTPIVLASTDHMAEGHLRQAQIATTTKSGCTVQVYGRELHKEDKKRTGEAKGTLDRSGYNDCSFFFVAIAPAD